MENPTTTSCTNCGAEIMVTSVDQGRAVQVVDGVTWHLGGGYGEFLDTMPGDDHRVVLCHDCVVVVFEALPGVAAKFEVDTMGWHPYDGDTPCCRWGWTLTSP